MSSAMTFPLSRSLPGLSMHKDGQTQVRRTLPEEVPVAMVYDGTTHAVMMASPGDIPDFALGFAMTEGIVTSTDQLLEYEQLCHEDGIEARFWLREDRRKALGARRRFMAGPVGCGLCGIDSLEQANRPLPRVGGDGLRLDPALVARATDDLREMQVLHARTHATHAAGFLVPGKGIVALREDVGRHNALDKLIGALVRDGLDPACGAFVMTSRLSVELVQKCAVAGCPALIAVSAPTSHALRLAEEAGITLVAFARQGGFDVYSHSYRITSEVTDVA